MFLHSCVLVIFLFVVQENAAQREKDDLVQEMKIMQVKIGWWLKWPKSKFQILTTRIVLTNGKRISYVYIYIYIYIYKLTERPVVLLNAIFFNWKHRGEPISKQCLLSTHARRLN